MASFLHTGTNGVGRWTPLGDAVDRENGEWHSGIDDQPEPVGRKGAEYKGADHNGRAMLECIDVLDDL